jgi:hypothetical protein
LRKLLASASAQLHLFLYHTFLSFTDERYRLIRTALPCPRARTGGSSISVAVGALRWSKCPGPAGLDLRQPRGRQNENFVPGPPGSSWTRSWPRRGGAGLR